MPDRNHQHDAGLIHHVKNTLGYDLASCRHCRFVAEASLDRIKAVTRIELRIWREPSVVEESALPQLYVEQMNESE